MSTLNFELGSLNADDQQLVLNNKTPYNKLFVPLEILLVFLGLYLLLSNQHNFLTQLSVSSYNHDYGITSPADIVFTSNLYKLVGVIVLGTGLYVSGSPHLERLTIDRSKQEVTVLERSWYGWVTCQPSYSFSRIIGLIVQGEYRESLLLYSVWLDVEDKRKICLGRVSHDRVEEVTRVLSTALELEDSQVKRLGS